MALKRSNYDPGAMFGATPNMNNTTAALALDPEWSGRNIVLNLAAGFAVTLPAANSGCEYTFLVKTAPTGNYTVVTNDGSSIIVGGVVNSAAGAGSTSSGCGTITFVANQAVAGDWVKVISDGTYWYATGICKVAAGVTLS